MQCDNARFPYHRSTLRSCETRESRGRARLPVTARGYSIFELEVYDFPFLPLLILNSVSKSGGSMGCEKGKDRRGSRFLENLDYSGFKSGSRKLSYNATPRFFISFVIRCLVSRSYDYRFKGYSKLSRRWRGQVRRQHLLPNKSWTWNGREGRD